MGDIAIIDFKAMRADTNELITGSQQRGMRLDTELGDRALGLAGGCCAALNSASGSTSVAGSCRPAETLYPCPWDSIIGLMQASYTPSQSPWGVPGGTQAALRGSLFPGEHSSCFCTGVANGCVQARAADVIGAGTQRESLPCRHPGMLCHDRLSFC